MKALGCVCFDQTMIINKKRVFSFEIRGLVVKPASRRFFID
jgi:hypothetical protein